MAKQRGLAAAEEAGEHRNRDGASADHAGTSGTAVTRPVRRVAGIERGADLAQTAASEIARRVRPPTMTIQRNSKSGGAG